MAHRWLRWLCLAVILTACGDPETGILLEISGPSGLHATTLQVLIATPDEAGVLWSDATASLPEIAISGRDLSADPYRFLLTPGSDSTAVVNVVVMARDAQGMAVGFGYLEPAQRWVSGVVIVRPVTIYAGAPAIEVTEYGCVRSVLERTPYVFSAKDQDCDDSPNGTDCNDVNPLQSPLIGEICNDGLDNDCNGTIDGTVDLDADGADDCTVDCNPDDGSVYPGAPEAPGGVCDGKDNDCDEKCDEDAACDGDGDGFGALCGDCLPEDPLAHPGAIESCDDDIDNDCDGACNNGCPDADGDGVFCGDCDPEDGTVGAGLPEICDCKDNDCDGVLDNGVDVDDDGFTPCGAIEDGLGGCLISPALADCNDGNGEIYPGAAELCDGLDNDCDGVCDDTAELDADIDGYTACGSLLSDTRCGPPLATLADCEPEIFEVHPNAVEVCDGFDSNCCTDDGGYAESRPCVVFESTSASCKMGSAACSEAGAEPTLGECVATTSEAVPLTLCTTSTNLACDYAVDPWTCVKEDVSLATSRTYGCSVPTSAGALCGASYSFSAEAGTSAVCRWRALGGEVQDHYVVSLEGADTCTVTLTLTALAACDTQPQYDTVLLNVDLGDGTSVNTRHLIRVVLAPVVSDGCAMTAACSATTP